MKIQRSPFLVAGKPMEWAKATGVRGGKGYVFLSGCVGLDPVTGKVPKAAGEQARIILENIKAVLEEYGSSLKNIVHIWKCIKGDFPNGIINDPRWTEIHRAIEDFWRQNCPEFCENVNPPADTVLGVTSLAEPELELEFTAIAAIE